MINKETKIWKTGRTLFHLMPYEFKECINEQREFHQYAWARRALARNARWKNKYCGRRCFILGNGPSLASLDFGQLSDEVTFTFNQITRNPDFAALRTNFHFWSDDKFYYLDARKPEDRELLDVMRAVNTEGNRPVVFYTLPAREPLIQKYRLDRELDIYYYSNRGAEIGSSVRQNLEPTHPFPDLPTTVHYAVCIAVYMGFQEIYLLGCDCTGFMNVMNAKLHHAEKSLYAYAITPNEKKRMESLANKYSTRRELESAVSVFEQYDYLRRYCEARGVKLYNATEGGLLDSLQRVNIQDVLRG